MKIQLWNAFNTFFSAISEKLALIFIHSLSPYGNSSLLISISDLHFSLLKYSETGSPMTLKIKMYSFYKCKCKNLVLFVSHR